MKYCWLWKRNEYDGYVCDLCVLFYGLDIIIWFFIYIIIYYKCFRRSRRVLFFARLWCGCCCFVIIFCICVVLCFDFVCWCWFWCLLVFWVYVWLILRFSAAFRVEVCIDLFFRSVVLCVLWSGEIVFLWWNFLNCEMIWWLNVCLVVVFWLWLEWCFRRRLIYRLSRFVCFEMCVWWDELIFIFLVCCWWCLWVCVLF